MTTRPRIWITRTEPAAQRSAKAWATAGFDPVVAPLLTVEAVANHDPIQDEAALIFTSSHGVRYCGVKPDDRPIYTVGEATAQTARDHGFKTVYSADGNWKTLVEIIEDKRKNYVHISGTIIRGEILETLNRRGFEVSRHIVYRTQPVQDWPVNPADIDSVALYSPLASQTLMGLPERSLGHLSAYCLSENVAAPLKGPKVYRAAKPTEAALMACSQTTEA